MGRCNWDCISRKIPAACGLLWKYGTTFLTFTNSSHTLSNFSDFCAAKFKVCATHLTWGSGSAPASTSRRCVKPSLRCKAGCLRTQTRNQIASRRHVEKVGILSLCTTASGSQSWSRPSRRGLAPLSAVSPLQMRTHTGCAPCIFEGGAAHFTYSAGFLRLSITLLKPKVLPNTRLARNRGVYLFLLRAQATSYRSLRVTAASDSKKACCWLSAPQSRTRRESG